MSIDRLPGLMLFARVAQHGSLTKAAQSLGLGRSSVSKQLARFEDQLGGRLLQRTTRKLALTELGERVLHEAEKVDLALTSIESLSADVSHQLRGRLRVTCSTSLGRVALLPLLPAFARQCPDIEIELGLEDRAVDLLAERIDVAIRLGHLKDSSLVARKLANLDWSLVASPDYLARRGQPKRPADLQQHACLFYLNSHLRMDTWSFEHKKRTEQVEVRGPLAINDACALVDAAINGVGILMIDRFLAATALKQRTLVPVLKHYRPTAGVPVYLVYPARGFLPARTRAFVKFLVDTLGPALNASRNTA